MALPVLAAKASVAVLLLAGGGAKLAGLAGFTAVVRLLAPAWVPARLVRAAAAAAAAAEVALGTASLSLPAAGWVNVAVLALTGGFLVVSVLGYARHRGRRCQCFGALSGGRFGALGTAQSTVIAAAAGLATRGAPPAMTALSAAQQLLLLLAAALVTLAAFSAAHAMSLARKLEAT